MEAVKLQENFVIDLPVGGINFVCIVSEDRLVENNNNIHKCRRHDRSLRGVVPRHFCLIF